jgi:hypothetical protein
MVSTKTRKKVRVDPQKEGNVKKEIQTERHRDREANCAKSRWILIGEGKKPYQMSEKALLIFFW